MRKFLLAALAIAPLAACATAPDQSASGSAPTASNPDTNMPFVEIFATPVYLALKVPVCGFAIAAALPLGAMSELNGSADGGGREMRRALNNGVAQSCGPPYFLTP